MKLGLMLLLIGTTAGGLAFAASPNFVQPPAGAPAVAETTAPTLTHGDRNDGASHDEGHGRGHGDHRGGRHGGDRDGDDDGDDDGDGDGRGSDAEDHRGDDAACDLTATEVVEDCPAAGDPATPGTVAPPANGLFTPGTAPVVKSN